MQLADNALLALDTIGRKPTRGIPSWVIHPMEHAIIDRLADVPEGSYVRDPETVYLKMQHRIGVCMIDQFIPTNPLSIGARGYAGDSKKGATTGAEELILDGIAIDSPEAVVVHLEKIVFPALRKQAAEFDEEATVRAILEREREVQTKFGPTILKAPYGLIAFPGFHYGQYGYANYFMAYALYPEVIEKDFALQADCAVPRNRAVARAYAEGRLPPFIRLDHDMADSRGTLVDIRSLDTLWFPHFARSLAPILKTDIKMIWHCDGNLAAMVPRLLEVGLAGFQGFQYEDGMDYEKICRMKTRTGDELLIIAGVSVTRTLPQGTPEDVRAEMKWLVAHGPRTGMFLGGSSSIAPGVSLENMQAFVEGLNYYREHGRG
ncbi:MAG: hypothetical protein HYV35_07795 [Lentisphaerae bacterium]|nr:hypothetical protein [Lentisphaerota bacterium]